MSTTLLDMLLRQRDAIKQLTDGSEQGISYPEFVNRLSKIRNLNTQMREHVEAMLEPGQFVLAPWLRHLPMMQQTVLLTAIRGPDGMPKEGPWKWVQRALRRTFLYCSMERQILLNPSMPGGGKFTGPLPDGVTLDAAFLAFIGAMDQLPHHYTMHVMHAAEIVGYKHPDDTTRDHWLGFYNAMVISLHLEPESVEDMDARLGDDEKQWREAADTHLGNLESV